MLGMLGFQRLSPDDIRAIGEPDAVSRRTCAGTVWTHRPIWPADPATHATDRVVVRDGERVGRVMRIEHGPRDGRRQWSGLWVGTDNRGMVDSLAEGLAAVRAGYAVCRRDDVVISRPSVDHWS